MHTKTWANSFSICFSMSRYIRNLIAEGEHVQQDFKYAINDSRKIARSLSAFANTQGGRLLIGVKDNGVIAGVSSDEEVYMVEAAANFYCRPSIEFSSKLWTIDGKVVVEIKIPESKNKPHLAEKDGKWMAYVRVLDENILADVVWMNYWKLQHRNEGVFMEYSLAERKLIQLLELRKEVSLEHFIVEAAITRKEAIGVLARMAALDVVEINYAEEGFVYSLKGQEL